MNNFKGRLKWAVNEVKTEKLHMTGISQKLPFKED